MNAIAELCKMVLVIVMKKKFKTIPCKEHKYDVFKFQEFKI